MMRWMLALLASLTLLSTAKASLSPKRQPEVRENLPTPVLAALGRTATPANDEFRLTARTEVLLNGRPCRYEDVPDGATIILLETASNESKEILKIHFRTTGRPASPAASKPPHP